jgi:hypothetical protein
MVYQNQREKPASVNPKIAEKVRAMAEKLGGEFRISRKCVPSIFVKKEDMTFSIAWFEKDKVWKVFYPFGEVEQTKVRCESDEEVVTFLKYY